MPHLPNSTIFVVGGQILTTGDFVFEADQGSLDQIIDDFGPPVINLIVPAYIMEGEEREIIMSGNRTYNPLGLAISGAGVTVEDVYVDNDGQITTRVQVDMGASSGADDMRDIVVTTLPGQNDSDGNSVEQVATFSNQLRIYFGAPALSGITYSDAGGSAIVNQGDTVTATFSGIKFYDQTWDENEAMTSSLATLAAQGIQLTSMTVDSPSQATATFTVDADAQRLSHSVKATTHSGDSNELASNLTVYYSTPTIAALTEQNGNDMLSISAGETKSLRLSGSRLEGVDAAGRIEIGQVDLSGNFNPSPTQEDGSGNLVLSNFATISNVSATTPAGTGANHSVDFDLEISQNIPSDLANIGFRITALDAAGSLQAVLTQAEAFSIDAAEPSISSIAVAGRPAGDDKSMFNGLGQQTVTISGANFYGDLASVALAGAPAGITLSGAQKNSDTEVQVNVEVGAAASLGVHNFVVTTEGGSATSANANSKLEIILPAPTLSTDPAQNNLFLDRPNSGTHVHTFTIDGANFMNIWDAGNTSDGLRATDGDFVTYYQGEDTMSAALTSGGNPASGLTNFSITATSATKATGTVTVAHNAPLGLVDMQVTTRSGATAVLGGVLDIIPGDPELTTVAPDHVMEGTGDVVITLSGANYHPAGDGAIAGSTLLTPRHPADANFTDANFTYQAEGDTSIVLRKVWHFASPVGGELVDVAVDANGAFEIAKFEDTGDSNANDAKSAAINAGGAPDSAWGSSLADLTETDWVVIRTKLDQAPGAASDTMTTSTEASPSQSISLDVHVMTPAEAVNYSAYVFYLTLNAQLPSAQAGDAGAIAYLQGQAAALQSARDGLQDYLTANSGSMTGTEIANMTGTIALMGALIAAIAAL